MTNRTARPGRVAILALVTLLTFTVTGCNNDDTSDLPPAPATEDTPSTAPESTLDPTRQAILDTYHGSVQAMVAAQRAADPDHPDLTRYFIDRTSALINVRNGIVRADARGTYYDGELVVVSAEVTSLDQDADPPEAVVESCLDDTEYRLVNRDDGSPVSDAEPGGRYRVTSKALLGTDDRWYIVASTAHWEEEC